MSEPKSLDDLSLQLDQMLKQILGDKQALRDELHELHNQQAANAAAIAALQTKEAPEFSTKRRLSQPMGATAGREGWEEEHQGAPRYHKLNFLTYDGEDDPLPWLHRCEQFFHRQRTMEEEKVWLASYHLTGVARQWFYQLERDEGVLTWPRFADFLNMRFGPPICSNPLGELAQLRRTGSVEDHQCQFLALFCSADPLSPMQQVQLFTSGLLKPLRTDVELQNPTNLQTAMSLARAYEVRLQEEPAEPKPPIRLKPLAPSAPTPTPSTPPPPTMTVAPPPGLRPTPARSKFRHLSTEEMADRRAKGLCYNCPEKFHLNHTCSMKGIYMLEIEDEDALADPVEQAEISLHALTGIQASRTMQLQVQIAGQTVLALVDS